MSYVSIIVGYLLGSIPFGYMVAKYWKGVNILEHGSGNIGFTNVLRTLGWGPGLAVLVGDVLKGAAAAWIGMSTGGQVFGILAGVAALLGHSFSLFLRFKGGKLVSTGFGVLLVLSWKVALTAALTWLIVVGVTRYVSVGSMLAGLSVFVSMFAYNESTGMTVFGAVAATLVIYRHRSNIQKLLRGEEYKIGQKAGPSDR